MGQGEGEGGAEGLREGSIVWSIVWLILLLIGGFWLASLCAFLYIFASIFAACCEGLDPLCEFLLKGVKAAGACARFMVHGTPIGEAFK